MSDRRHLKLYVGSGILLMILILLSLLFLLILPSRRVEIVQIESPETSVPLSERIETYLDSQKGLQFRQIDPDELAAFLLSTKVIEKVHVQKLYSGLLRFELGTRELVALVLSSEPKQTLYAVFEDRSVIEAYERLVSYGRGKVPLLTVDSIEELLDQQEKLKTVAADYLGMLEEYRDLDGDGYALIEQLKYDTNIGIWLRFTHASAREDVSVSVTEPLGGATLATLLKSIERYEASEGSSVTLFRTHALLSSD